MVQLRRRLRMVGAGLALAATLLATGAQAASQPIRSAPRDEHVRLGPPVQRVSHPNDTLARTPATGARPATAAGVVPFLTRPYWGPHSVTSIFDHCNPDYSLDGLICDVDGNVARRSNNVDPSFNAGYAYTPHGTDYVYYDGHNGWDISLNYETLLAAADGTVVLDGVDAANPGFGTTVTIDHGNGFTTRYAHMSAVFVHSGQHVIRGQQIGTSGNSGNSTGPHLHFGVYVTSSWEAIDPWGWNGTTADPWPYDAGDLWIGGNPQDPLPTAPRAVSAAPGDASAVVSWTPPSFDGGDGVSNYIVTVSPGGQTFTVGGTATSVRATGLTNNTPYTFTVTAANQIGQGPASAPSPVVTPISAAGPMRPVTPTRVFDTRTGTPLASGQVTEITVAGVGGVPATGASSVVLNLTAADATAPGFLAAFAGGTTWPGNSSVNFGPGHATANLVQAAIGADGKVAVANGSSGTVDVIADIYAWSADAPATTSGVGLFRALAPARIMDTRDGNGGLAAPMASGQRFNLQVTGRGGVPASGVAAVILNVTVTGPTAPGFVALYPAGGSWAGTSNVNFMAGQTIPNRVLVPVGAGGQVTIANADDSVHVIVDVSGWYSDASGSGSPGLYDGALPARLLDTRNGTGGVSSPLGPGGIAKLQVAGTHGVPTTATAVVLNLTGVDSTEGSFVVAYPDGTSWPLASDLNLSPGDAVSNLVVVKLGADGAVDFINASGSTDLIADLVGWYS